MSFSVKLMAYSAAASVLLATSPVLVAEPIVLSYQSVSPETAKAKELWGDVLPNAEMIGDQPPSVFVADAGDGIEVSLVYASNMCSMDKCPIRVFDHGEKIEDTMACYNIQQHQIAESRTALSACNEVILINRVK